MLIPGTVPGEPGRPELMAVRSSGGLHRHLLDKQAGEALCRGLRSGTVRLDLGPLYPEVFADLSGRRCLRAAVKAGYTQIITDDGPLDLAEVLTRERW
ncbi:hypothetical protein [Amycolatopsis sp. FDAARGOS 1241]|uniref:hypothetical protein n=1 Tax=Amycolatopsis sp. FDAARGOS 1241 TaxID=2778070 RepID=UPI00195141DD|nr:hypothetical protein [Amycolatopsis sp. FDAARGOS 1241]QRP43037.1 hypothetical protein I6J71_26795 [Amycolatopsis sp. FDAARGOS 1241]